MLTASVFYTAGHGLFPWRYWADFLEFDTWPQFYGLGYPGKPFPRGNFIQRLYAKNGRNFRPSKVAPASGLFMA